MPRPLALAALVVVAATGCMTIFNGTQEKVPVVTYPVRTTVKIVDSAGKTVFDGPVPAEVMLKRSETYTFSASAPGFKPTKVTATGEASRDNIWGGILCNAILGELPIVIDIATGAMKTYGDTGVELTLLRDRQGPAADAGKTVPMLVSTDTDAASGHPLLIVAQAR